MKPFAVTITASPKPNKKKKEKASALLSSGDFERVYQNETGESRVNQTDLITDEPQPRQTTSQKTKLGLAKEEEKQTS